MIAQRSSSKSTYGTWARFFDEGDNTGVTTSWICSHTVVCVPERPENGLNPFIFPLAILLVKGKKLALARLYLGLLYAHMDECVSNVVCSMGRMIT